ncbi:MAG: SGNH/GDSL hydrolase family protein [Rhodospirillales bacterium]|nr:SGNH/GDSL hydrolase family protein [Rhodospirillales bacterium]
MHVPQRAVRRASLLLAAIILTMLCASWARAASFDGLVVFGDSLSDTGNVGRFSDGPLWVEFIADRLGVDLRPSRLGGTNYATAGAHTHGGPADVRAQVHAFLAAQGEGGGVPASALYIVYAGANNLLAGGCGAGRDAAARTAAAALHASIEDLATAGARYVVVPNLPDLGLTPVARERGAACAREFHRLTMLFNAALEEGLESLEAGHPLTVMRLNVFALSRSLVAGDRSGQPTAFDNVTRPCLDDQLADGRNEERERACAGSLFWDHLHPSSAAHRLLAEATLAILGLPDAPLGFSPQ